MSTTEQTTEPGGELKREFSLWSSFAFAFAFISPIVALYGILGVAYGAGGPSFWWTFPIVFAGQLLVALVFAELVSRWPLEGSIYQWSRHLVGEGFGWAAGWVYMWTLVVAMAAVAIGAAGFVANVVGWHVSAGGQALIAFVILLLGTAANIGGRLILKILMTGSIIAEIVGSLGLGTWLLVFHRQNEVGVLTSGFHTSGYLSLSGPFLLTMAFVGFSFVGFESAGAIAEEVEDPKRSLPKAIVFSITFIAVVVTYSALAIILSIPRQVAEKSTDPVYDTLRFHLGNDGARAAEVLFTIGFLASFLALQTSASRVIWAYARDRALPASRTLARLSAGQRQPVPALVLATVIGSAVILLSQLAPSFYTLILNFTSGGFFLAFLFPLVGNLLARRRGTWSPGVFTLGRATTVISVAATVWALLEFANIAWPRNAYPTNPVLNWSVVLAVVGLAVIGWLVHRSVRSQMTLTDEPLPDHAPADTQEHA